MPQVIPAVASVITTVGTAVSAFAASSPILWGAVKLVGSLALSSILTPKPKLNSTGAQLDFKADLNAGLPVVLGRTAVGGNLIFQYVYGKHNRFLSLFAILTACGPAHAIESFTADTTAVTFASDGQITNNPPFKYQMFQTQRLGATPDTALPQPGGQATADGTFGYWTSAHKLSGYACVWWDVQYDTTLMPALPQPRWVIQGVKCYDPRYDSTYPGGSGSQRSNDASTWAYSTNPYVQAITFLIGWWQNGKKVAGVGAPIDSIDLAAYVEGANIADANGWMSNGSFTTQDSKWQVLQAILQAGGGAPIQMGAMISCTVSAPKTSLATMTANDLCGPSSIAAMMGRRDRINTVVPTYRSEANDWQMVPAAPVKGDTYVTEDGETRSKQITYSFVQDVTQLGQLAAYDVANSREFQPITLQVKPRWLGYRPGDCITIDIPELGLNSQKAVILTRTMPDPQTGVINLTLRSETDAKHSFALGKTAVAPPTPGLSVPDFSTVPAPASGQWTATATAQVGGGASVPCITITGDASDYSFCADVVIEYRKTGDTDWIAAQSAPASSTSITIVGLGGSTNYDVAVSYKSVYGVSGAEQGARLVLGPITTLAGYGVASSILNQGSLATANNVKFGDGTVLESGGGTATDLNYKTPLGTAAAIAGQGAFATLSNVSYGSGYLTGFGQLAGLQYIRTGLSGVSGDSIGLYSNTYGWLSDGNIYTALGTAAAISGQGALATLSSVDLSSGQVTNKSAQYISYSAGGTVDSLKPAQAGADVTGSHTAAAISGQGAFATFSQIALNTTYITRADGSTSLTESLVITNIGVAAAVSGQGSLATKNQTDTPDITAGAVTNSNYQIYTSAATISTNIAPTVASVALTTVGSTNVKITADLWLDPNHGSYFYVDIYRDSTRIARLDSLQCLGTRASWAVHFLDTDVPAGAHTYSIQLHVSSGSDQQVGFVYRYIEVTELKR